MMRRCEERAARRVERKLDGMFELMDRIGPTAAELDAGTVLVLESLKAGMAYAAAVAAGRPAACDADERAALAAILELIDGKIEEARRG